MKPQSKIAFETSRPVTGDAFFGRANELTLCEQRLKYQQSILITGESQIGKTSLLLELGRRVELWPDKVRVVFGEFDLFQNAEAALWGLQQIFEPGSQHKGSRRVIKGTIRSIENSSRPIIAFLNDFDSILRLSPDTERYGYFLKTLIDAGHTAVCGTAQRSAFVNQNGQMIPFPLVSFFSEVALRGFTEEEASYFLRTASRLSGDELTNDEIKYITTLAGLVPHNLQRIGFELFSLPKFAVSTGGERLDHLTRCIEKIAWDYQSQFFHRIADDPIMTDTYWERLVEIAHGKKDTSGPESHYLQKRGFISEGDEPFANQGTLFKEFLRSIPVTDDRDTPLRDRIAHAGEVAMDAAIKAAVKLAFG
jgi:hypothetical protein